MHLRLSGTSEKVFYHFGREKQDGVILNPGHQIIFDFFSNKSRTETSKKRMAMFGKRKK